MIAASLVGLFLFQWENKNDDLITIGFLIYDKQIKMSSDLLYPHHTHFVPPYPISSDCLLIALVNPSLVVI